jgi:hypothetical protein
MHAIGPWWCCLVMLHPQSGLMIADCWLKAFQPAIDNLQSATRNHQS